MFRREIRHGRWTYRGVVQSARDNADDLVGEAKALVELLRSTDHLVEELPALLGLAEDELLDLLELVDTEDTPGIAAVASGLFPEARAVSGVLNRELGGL